MPWDDQNYRTIAVELFGGLVAEEDPADIPEGASPLCNDVEFEPGSVFQRRGLSPVYPPLAGNPTVNYIRTFKEQDGQGVFTLLLDVLGNLWREDVVNTPNALTNISTGIIVPGSYAFSTTYLAREYIAFHNGNYGIDIPRQYDGTNLDRVSQCGPGAAPYVSDEGAPINTSTVGGGGASGVAEIFQPGATNAITSIVQNGNLVTVVPSGSNFAFITGESVVIAGVTPSGFNGTFKVTWLPGFTGFTYILATLGLGTGAGGTAGSQAAYFNFVLPNSTGFAGFPGAQQAVISMYSPIYPQGLSVTVTGAGVGGYNGTWTVLAVKAWHYFWGGFNHFYLQLVLNIGSVGLANSSGASLQVNGNIVAGVHKMAVMFLTRQGYLTAPSPITSYTASGTKRAYIFNIPVGPPNVIARVLCFTAAGGANFFTIGAQTIPGITPVVGSNMTIPDNTTTTFAIDFTDVLLLASDPVDQPGSNLFALEELGECLGVIQYGLRTVWWGERNKLENVLNFTFDGGFGPVGSGGAGVYPFGWTPDATSYAGGGSANALTLPVVWGDAYAITGNGNAIIGLISQSVYQDENNVPILPVNAPISIRVRVAQNGTLIAGTLHLVLNSASLGVLGVALSIPAASLTTKYQEFTAQLTPALASIPADAVMQIYADGTPTTGGTFLVDCVELFPTTVPYNDSQLRVSYVENPESFDGVTGLIQVSPGDGQQIRSCFILRNIFYIAKDRSLYATQDNGSTEPSGWTVSQISATIGTCSVNGVAYPKGTEEGGEDWAIIANKKGLYMFSGGEAMKMSQEMQNDLSTTSTAPWDTINWANANTLWCVNDSRARQIYIGAPTGVATTPSKLLMLDYKELNTSYMVGEQGPIHTSYSGRVISWEPGRKWSPWTMSINIGAMIDRPNGQSVLFLGNNTSTGKVYQLLAPQYSDDGVAIPSVYTTYAMPSREQERDYQLWSNRKFFRLMTLYLQGNGNINIRTFPLNLNKAGPVYILTPNANPIGDMECPLHVAGERCFFQIQSNFAGNWWKVRTMAVRMRPHAVARIRQSNAV